MLQNMYLMFEYLPLGHASIGYCFALAFSFLSVLFLFIALRAEFLRLKQVRLNVLTKLLRDVKGKD